jgi:23S rRNA pseudouridine2605 synthase
VSEPIRLQKFLSQAGVAARRKAEVLITEGRVKVNGKVVTMLGTKVHPADRVEVDGQRVKNANKLMYFLLNKPKACISTVSDPQGRKTVMDYLPPNLPVRVRPVGRLDYHTEGVLILTNDGELHSALLSPRSQVEKTYHAKIKGEVTDATLTKWRKGVRLDDGRDTAPAQVDRLRPSGPNATSQPTWLVITIREGQSRQIHRTAAALGHEVLKLSRVSFAGLTYFGVRVGDCRPLSPDEILLLQQKAGLQGATDDLKVLKSKRTHEQPRGDHGASRPPHDLHDLEDDDDLDDLDD